MRPRALAVSPRHSGREVDRALRFEISADDYRVTLVETEEEIVAGMAVYDALTPELLDAAVAADVDVFAPLEAEILPWLAERWSAVGGPRSWPRAYVFFHEDWDPPRYDLER